MNPPPMPSATVGSVNDNDNGERELSRTTSLSQSSDDSQTAADFIDSQLKLEADAREALPYKFDTCTRPLGPLRQLLFACLTCNPPPNTSFGPYTPAAVCYSCSVQCHGEHTLVELFNKRNFVCDCGTTRLPPTSPCTLRLNPLTNQKGDVTSETPEQNNKYNHNFQNRFCGCNCDYDAHQQKGTMFQCLGLGTAEEGGCGEDWWHTGCIVGLGPTWYEDQDFSKRNNNSSGGTLENTTEYTAAEADNRVGEPTSRMEENDDDDIPPAPGFPEEDEFEGFICYKCVNAFPWIKRYAGTQGFLAPVLRRSAAPSPESELGTKISPTEAIMFPVAILNGFKTEVDEYMDASPLQNIQSEQPADPMEIGGASETLGSQGITSRKRKTDKGGEDAGPLKRVKEDETNSDKEAITTETTGISDNLSLPRPNAHFACKYEQLPPVPDGSVSLFFKPGFRERFCRCSDCFPRLAKHPQLLEEEEAYEPPISSNGEDGEGSTVGSGSLLDRGERALTNIDRVRAIEGVMAYNHLKEKLKPFFKEFAESGKAISAEDIKAHFAKIRGDEEAIKQAGEAAAGNVDNRREQSGF